jgi:hypothetical protein
VAAHPRCLFRGHVVGRPLPAASQRCPGPVKWGLPGPNRRARKKQQHASNLTKFPSNTDRMVFGPTPTPNRHQSSHTPHTALETQGHSADAPKLPMFLSPNPPHETCSPHGSPDAGPRPRTDDLRYCARRVARSAGSRGAKAQGGALALVVCCVLLTHATRAVGPGATASAPPLFPHGMA